MIIAEISNIATNFAMVRFSEPDEDFKNKPFTPIYSSKPEEEIRRMVYFKNREYILQKLTSFLNQRSHALPANTTIISLMLADLDKIKHTPLSNVATWVANNVLKFERVAPYQKSKYHNHYSNTIEPILLWCKAELQQRKN